MKKGGVGCEPDEQVFLSSEVSSYVAPWALENHVVGWSGLSSYACATSLRLVVLG